MSVTAQQLKPLDGYEQLFGSKKAMVAELVGPASYLAGGQTVTAAQLGWGGFDHAVAQGFSLSGTFYGKVQLLPLDPTPSEFLGAAQSFKMVWYVTSTNAQVADAVDLSAEVMRFFAIGV